MRFVVKIAGWAGSILVPLGGKGLFLAAAIDSSFLPLPEGVDFWLMSLSLHHPARIVYYVVLATLGSVLGCCAVYVIARRAEEAFVEKHPKYSRLLRIQKWLEKYEMPVLLIGAILPPPTPFKLIVVAAGVVKCRFDRFVIALLIGRAIRYGLEAVLAIRYGHQVWEWLVKSGPQAFALVLLASLIAFLVHRMRCKATVVMSNR